MGIRNSVLVFVFAFITITPTSAYFEDFGRPGSFYDDYSSSHGSSVVDSIEPVGGSSTVGGGGAVAGGGSTVGAGGGVKDDKLCADNLAKVEKKKAEVTCKVRKIRSSILKLIKAVNALPRKNHATLMDLLRSMIPHFRPALTAQEQRILERELNSLGVDSDIAELEQNFKDELTDLLKQISRIEIDCDNCEDLTAVQEALDKLDEILQEAEDLFDEAKELFEEIKRKFEALRTLINTNINNIPNVRNRRYIMNIMRSYVRAIRKALQNIDDKILNPDFSKCIKKDGPKKSVVACGTVTI